MRLVFTTNAGFGAGDLIINKEITNNDSQLIDKIINLVNMAIIKENSEDGIEEFARTLNEPK